MKLYRVGRRPKGTEKAFTWVPGESPAYVIRDKAEERRSRCQELDDSLAKIFYETHKPWEYVVQESEPDWATG